jgi:hypothetical protein
MAGAAITVGGLNVASYAGVGHHAAATHGPSAHRTAPDRSTPAQAKVRHGAYVFKVPHHTTLPFFFQLKSVPKGRYAASFDVATTSLNGPAVPFCYVLDSTSPFAVRAYGQDHGDPTDDVAIASASGIVKLAHKGQVGLACQDADETENDESSQNTLVLTPLHHVATGKGTRISAKSASHPQLGRGR